MVIFIAPAVPQELQWSLQPFSQFKSANPYLLQIYSVLFRLDETP